MRTIVQRVREAQVEVESKIISKIGIGLLIYVGIGKEDEKTDADWLANKIQGLRIFDDEEGYPNLSLNQIQGEILIVSQFTLLAKTKKGFRPSYTSAGDPQNSKALIDYLVEQLKKTNLKSVQEGIFGANMQVTSINDGPMTIWLDTKNKE